MMKQRLWFSQLYLIGLLVLSACSSIPVSQDYLPQTDFSSLHSYRWDQTLLQKEANVENNDPLLNHRIHQAIDKTLQARGYRLVDKAPADFRVSYQTRVRSRLESDGITGSFAIGFGHIGHSGAIGIHTGNIITEQDEATLMIDIIDDATGQLLWRGASTRRVSQYTDPEKLTHIINRHVDAILTQFPPQHRLY